jgi:hypothetical protein
MHIAKQRTTWATKSLFSMKSGRRYNKLQVASGSQLEHLKSLIWRNSDSKRLP